MRENLLHHRMIIIIMILIPDLDDFKWAHEFLKEIKNNRGENPPDVKACLNEIQDHLINLYARLNKIKEGA